MKKIISFTMLAALVAVPVFAQSNDQVQNGWFNQMFQNHQQMTRQAVNNGVITADQAAKMDEHMQQMAPIMQDMMQNDTMMMNGMMGNSGMMNRSGMMNTQSQTPPASNDNAQGDGDEHNEHHK